MFIKIGSDDHIDALQKRGQIYCNTIKYFRSVEGDTHRGDENEGKAYMRQAKNLEILVEGKVIARAMSAQIYYDHPQDVGNIYCLYGVQTSLVNLNKQSLQKVYIESGSKGFGESALLIHHPEEFLNRISIALHALSKKYNFSPVIYFDHTTYEGELSPFYKSNKYEYQNEVRLWIPNTEDRPFEFFIGDISDISHRATVEDLDKIEVDVIKPSDTN